MKNTSPWAVRALSRLLVVALASWIGLAPAVTYAQSIDPVARGLAAYAGSPAGVSSAASNLAYTWNSAGVQLTGLKVNVTDTASASTSLLARFQVGGVDKVSFRKDGLIRAQTITLAPGGNFLIEGLNSPGPMISKTDGGNVLAIRNQSSAQYSESTVTFRDSSSAHSGVGIETMAFGYDNGGSNDPFSNVNFLEFSNDPESGASTNLPKEFRIIQTGYQDSPAVYKSRMRYKLAGDGSQTWYDVTNGYATPGVTLLSMPALATSAGSFGFRFGVPFGAVGTPAIFFNGQATTGLYTTGATDVRIASNGQNVGSFLTTGLQVGSGKLQYDVATATNPVILPQQGDTKAGIGGTSGNVSLIANVSGTATEIVRATSAGALDVKVPLTGTSAVFATTVKTTGTTVAGLPAAATVGAGARAFVTDATTPTFGATVTGGGSTPAPVYSDGSAWKVG
jgi:hypothetical protein